MKEETEEEKKNDDNDNSSDHSDGGEFQKVPIEHSIEIINIINNMNKITRDKFKKKFFKQFLVVIVIIIFLYITKRMIYDGIIKYIFEEKEESQENNDFFLENSTYNEEINETINKEAFYLIQNETNINVDSCIQLRNPKKIKLIENLEITLNLEYEKFIHLKIKDAKSNRWEMPEKDIINKDYLNNITDSILTLSKNTKILDSEDFYVEYLKNDENDFEDYEEEKDIDDFNDNIIFDDEFSFRIMTDDKKEFYYFNTSQNFIFSDTFISFQSKLTSDKIYGFGERTHDFELGEGIFTMWSFDSSGTKYDDGKGGMNQYSHQPIGLHKTRFKNLWLGFVFMNTNAQDVVLNYNKEDDSEMFLTHKTIGGIIDYYIIVDKTPENVIKNIQFLLGIPPLPPYWSLGNHQCRYGIQSFQEFKNIYNNYKKYEIPIDAMWIDIDAMDNYEVFTISKKFEKIKDFIKEKIHKDGGKFVPIIDIGISYENKNSTYIQLGNSLDIFIKSNYTKETLIGKVWPGKTVFPDFFNPKVEKFWKKGLNDYNKLVNYDGIWLDMNEPANMVKKAKCLGEIVDDNLCTKDKNKYYNEDLPYFPGYRKNSKNDLSFWSISENALIYGNNTIYNVKPLLAFYQSKLTYEFLENNLKIRPFILSRSTTLSSGKYAFHWIGDNYSTNENLKNSISAIFNFNIFGIPFTGADICGFNKNATKELCLRWYNLGAFYPFMRNHNSKRAIDQYPWSFNNFNETKYDSISNIKKNINIRYSLLRYMYSQFFLISLNEKGSFFKPIMFEFPEERKSYEDIESRIMFGEAFLICTFYDSNEEDKTFIFPKSNFNEYPSGKTIIYYEEENRKIKLSGKLNITHIFLRGGFIVPYQNTFDKYIMNTIQLRDEKMNLIININNLKESKGVIFFDNDEINTIKKMKYIRVDLTYRDKVLSINTNKNNLEKYNFDDHILGTIEFWEIDEIFEIKKEKGNQFKLNIVYNKDKNKKKEIREGIYDKDRNKVTFEISKKNDYISIFDIQEFLIH